jgi:hypothetical protein
MEGNPINYCITENLQVIYNIICVPNKFALFLMKVSISLSRSYELYSVLVLYGTFKCSLASSAGTVVCSGLLGKYGIPLHKILYINYRCSLYLLYVRLCIYFIYKI